MESLQADALEKAEDTSVLLGARAERFILYIQSLACVCVLSTENLLLLADRVCRSLALCLSSLCTMCRVI